MSVGGPNVITSISIQRTVRTDLLLTSQDSKCTCLEIQITQSHSDKFSLLDTHLGVLSLSSRVSRSVSPLSSSSILSEGISITYNSLFGNTRSSSSCQTPKYSEEEEVLNHRTEHTDISDQGSYTTEQLDSDRERLYEEESDTENGYGRSGALVAARNHHDEDDEVIKSESDDDEALSNSSHDATPVLNRATTLSPNPTPVSTPAPTATSTPAPVTGHISTTAPPKRVHYEHTISHPAGRFKHLVDLDDDEPVPKFEYTLHQKDRLRSHVSVIPMKRKYRDEDREGESE